jgi:hypothetical protein
MRGSAVHRLAARLAAVAALTLGASCLPADSRKPPGSVLLSVSPPEAQEVTTADGWGVSLDRLLIGIGDLELSGARECEHYSDARYTRLLDARRPEDQKVGIVYGLGACNIGFRLVWPNEESVLGAGVTEADRQLLGTSDPGRYMPPQPGVTLDIAATATRDGTIKHLHWYLRQMIGINCRTPGGSRTSPLLELKSNEAFQFHVAIEGLTFLQDDVQRMASVLRFDAFAAADDTGDADGEVTLDELRRVPLEVAQRSGAYGTGLASPPSFLVKTLEDYVHLVLVFNLARLREDLPCTADGFGGRGPTRPP